MLGNVHSPYIRGQPGRCSAPAGYGKDSLNSKRLWIILESSSLIRLARCSLICRYRHEAIGSRA